MGGLPTVWRMLLADRYMCCCPTAKLSIFPVARWHSGKMRLSPSAGSIRNFAPRATTRCVLAPTAAQLDARIRAGGDGLASSSTFGSCILATTVGLWPSRGDAQTKVAGEIQRHRPSHVDWAALRKRIDLTARPRRPHLSRHLGLGAISANGRSLSRAAAAVAAYARVVSLDSRRSASWRSSG